jgi:hypothetical protein
LSTMSSGWALPQVVAADIAGKHGLSALHGLLHRVEGAPVGAAGAQDRRPYRQPGKLGGVFGAGQAQVLYVIPLLPIPRCFSPAFMHVAGQLAPDGRSDGACREVNPAPAR